jgi:hypothetical protein
VAHFVWIQQAQSGREYDVPVQDDYRSKYAKSYPLASKILNTMTSFGMPGSCRVA